MPTVINVDDAFAGKNGATENEWYTLVLIQGHQDDLLPVVTDPTATISPARTIKEQGKTPSVLPVVPRPLGQ